MIQISPISFIIPQNNKKQKSFIVADIYWVIWYKFNIYFDLKREGSNCMFKNKSQLYN